MSVHVPDNEARTVPMLRACKSRGQKLVMVTAYDAAFAKLADEAGADFILVGDSLGMVIQGQSDTLSVTLEEMIYHTRCVKRASARALVVTDLPFMSYQVSAKQALRSAGRVIKEGGAQAVKLEGGQPVLPAIRAIVAAGIPVVGHLGLTPQSVHAMGGFRVQARDDASAQQLERDALAIEEAGAFALVLEGIPAQLAAKVTARLMIPTIGIGAGPACDGQVLVMHDLLGLFSEFTPKFVKRYAELGQATLQAFSQYAAEVRDGTFPSAQHAFGPLASAERESMHVTHDVGALAGKQS
jgi:3-methyl-2-oxobutanoate hydroxymethyltransferase